MVQQLADQILTSDSDEIAELKANLSILEGFIDLASEINGLPNIKSRFFEESRSLYQVTASHEIDKLEALLTKFFGPPAKPSGKPLPRKLRKSSVVTYLGGLQKDQSLFLLSLKTGHFYGALWPWRRNRTKIEIHLGYCSDWMSDDDYGMLEALVNKSISQGTFEQVDANIGGQIHGIGLPSFLQMAELENSSFSLRITSQNRVGNLHLSDGRLFAAELDGNSGSQVAYEIISWDNAAIDIEPLDESKSDDINQPLMQVLMESLKLKDEGAVSDIAPREQQESELEEESAQLEKQTPRSQRPSPGRLIRLKAAPQPKIKRQKIDRKTLAYIAIGAIITMALAYMASAYVAGKLKTPDEYHYVMSMVNQQKSLEDKIAYLQKQIDLYPTSPYAAKYQAKILEMANEIEDREYDKIRDSISALPLDEHYENKAVSAYEAFLKKYPKSRFKKEVKTAIKQTIARVDKHYFDELKDAARLKFKERLNIYRGYLAKFPEGKYVNDVKTLVKKIGNEQLALIKTRMDKCDTKNQWDPCINELNFFVEAYQDMPQGTTAEQLRAKMVDKRDFFKLRRRVLDTGTDYQKGYQIYESYLSEHPQTTQKKTIEKEMAELSLHFKGQKEWQAIKVYGNNTKYALTKRIKKVQHYIQKNSASPFAGSAKSLLDRLTAEHQLALRQKKVHSGKREAEQRLQRERALKTQQQERIRQWKRQLKSQLTGLKRFRTDGSDTVVDQTTGLTWALLDSQQELGGCLTYEAAQIYVRNLTHGGKKDWRLPTASELASIYKKSPFYPGTGNQWYWSSETYEKGYHSFVVVVTEKQETVFKPENRKLSECGTVRAVR